MSDPTPTLTPFSQLIQGLKEVDKDHHVVTVPSDWLQGRTAYGGLSAALCLEAVQRAIPGLPPLRSAQFAFIGPATGELRVTSSTLRAGRSSVFAGADLMGEDGLATRATFCFGRSRAVDHDHAEVPAPASPPLESLPDYFGWPGQPNFMSHFDGRLAAGAGPRTPGAEPRMLVWLRHRDEGVDPGMVSMLAMADALPPAAMVLFRAAAPISTMTWSIEILDPDFHSDTGWWLVKCTADTAQAGYSAQQTTIWSPDGKPVLIARQNVAIFSKPA